MSPLGVGSSVQQAVEHAALYLLSVTVILFNSPQSAIEHGTYDRCQIHIECKDSARRAKRKMKTKKFSFSLFRAAAYCSLSMCKVINEILGTCSSTYNGYQWDEIVSVLFVVYLCRGGCVEDVNRGSVVYANLPMHEYRQVIPLGLRKRSRSVQIQIIF